MQFLRKLSRGAVRSAFLKGLMVGGIIVAKYEEGRDQCAGQKGERDSGSSLLFLPQFTLDKTFSESHVC